MDVGVLASRSELISWHNMPQHFSRHFSCVQAGSHKQPTTIGEDDHTRCSVWRWL